MKRIMVRYKVKPEHAAENSALVRDVYTELALTTPAGFRYGTFTLDDGVSFVHLATQEGEQSPLGEIAAFRRFQAGIGDRCEEPPVVTELHEVGSFRFDGETA